MKQFVFIMLLIAGMAQVAFAKGTTEENVNSCTCGYPDYQHTNASITIRNCSEYTLTVKILKTGGRGLYRTVSISPKSSAVVAFYSNDTFFTKTKAVKGGLVPETLYRKGNSFSVQCDSNGYTEGTLEFYVSSGSSSCGQSISRSEFERDK